MNEHGYCPHCNADLDGENIVNAFQSHGYDLDVALSYASNYGYGPGNTKFGRQVGLYDINFDRVVAYRCPDCNGQWEIK